MNTKKAYMAGGCFWCTETDLRALPGVVNAISGYAGGKVANPTYEQVGAGGTGHREAVEIEYDPEKIAYEKLVDFFLENIDPTDAGGQFYDRGETYTTAIFYQTDEEKQITEKVIDELNKSGVYEKPIVTKVLPYINFYPADSSHQNYAKKNPGHYYSYRTASGRDIFVGRVCQIKEAKKGKKA